MFSNEALYEDIHDYNRPVGYRNIRNRYDQSMPVGSMIPSHQARQHDPNAMIDENDLVNWKQHRVNTTMNGNFGTALTLEQPNQNVFSLSDIVSRKGSRAENRISHASILAELTINNEESLVESIDRLKESKLPMWRKKQIRLQLMAKDEEVNEESSSKTATTRWRRFMKTASKTMHSAKLWRSSINEIEGRYGTGESSYFTFLRWVFLLNIYTYLLIFIFIVLPTILFESLRSSGSITGTIPEKSVSPECQYNPYNSSTVYTFPQYIIWCFTAEGFIENTLLFSGYYENVVLSVDALGLYYNIPVAYLLVTFFYFFISLVFLVRRASKGLRESFVIEEQFFSYFRKVFDGWNHRITGKIAAELKHNSLTRELQANLQEEQAKLRKQNQSRTQKALLYLKRIVVNLLVLVVISVALVVIFLAAQFSLANEFKYDDRFLLDLLVTYLTSIAITAVNFIAPILFELFIRFEDYSPYFAIRLTLVRTTFLKLASVIFLYFVIYAQINCEEFSFVALETEGNCSYCRGIPCWETYLGQEMYKLTLLDFLIAIAVVLFIDFPRTLIGSCCHCNKNGKSSWWGKQEFSIPTNVLDIIYSQTVGWIGAFYAPLLPILVVVKFFVFFYLKKLTLLYNCHPTTRPYRASRSGTFFYLILLFGFAVAVIPVIVGIGVLTPSKDCGPFRQWDTMFSVITTSILTHPTWVQQMFWVIGSSWFTILIIAFVSFSLYGVISLTTSRKKFTVHLKGQLLWARKDNLFLKKRYRKSRKKLTTENKMFPQQEQNAQYQQHQLHGEENYAYVS